MAQLSRQPHAGQGFRSELGPGRALVWPIIGRWVATIDRRTTHRPLLPAGKRTRPAKTGVNGGCVSSQAHLPEVLARDDDGAWSSCLPLSFAVIAQRRPRPPLEIPRSGCALWPSQPWPTVKNKSRCRRIARNWRMSRALRAWWARGDRRLVSLRERRHQE